MDQVLTAAEWQAFTADQRRKNGIRGAAELFPWLLDSAPAERIQAALKGLPPPLRVVYRRIWQPRYARHDHWEPSVRSRRS
jgi:type II secretory pathway component PulM